MKKTISELVEKRIPFVVIQTNSLGVLDRFVAISGTDRKKHELKGYECIDRTSIWVKDLEGEGFRDFMSYRAAMTTKNLGAYGTAYHLPELQLKINY